MARVRMQHAVTGGWDVLLDVAGEGVTMSFPRQPTDAELSDVMDRLDREKMDRVADNTVTLTDEVLGDDI